MFPEMGVPPVLGYPHFRKPPTSFKIVQTFCAARPHLWLDDTSFHITGRAFGISSHLPRVLVNHQTSATTVNLGLKMGVPKIYIG